METSQIPDAPQQQTLADPSPEAAARLSSTRGRLRVWPAVVFVAAYWLFAVSMRFWDATIYVGFLSGVAASLLLALSTSIWWLANRKVAFGDRLIVLLFALGGGALAGWVSDPSVGIQSVLFMGPPIAFSIWVLWLLFARKKSTAFVRNGSLAALALAWSSFLVVRVDGVDGDQNAALDWRWGRTSEDLYLADLAHQTAAAPSVPDSPLALGLGDWPQFRGTDELGEVPRVKIATNWSDQPPQLIWRQRIGPAWSSVAIVGQCLFTQEQRGEFEAAICLDAATGHERWAHQDKDRFSDGQAGPGPRSSPAFFDGCLYSLGAKGILNCIDASSGQVKWTRNISVDSGAPVPMWGFSSSPIVVDGHVVVFAGGEQGLLAYKAKSGDKVWTAPTGPVSYSSPQLAQVCGQKQILILSDRGLAAVDPASGKTAWEYAALGTQIWRVAQPHPIGDSTIIFGSEDLGLIRLDLTHKNGEWAETIAWRSRALRPAYNDFIYSSGFVYGFDEGIFCCVDAKTGKRNWKAGRYGHGQAILLPEQKLVFVISETGEAILVAARSDRHEELARFQAIKGKTWNHPVIAHGRLYLRNSEEIACYELPGVVVQEARRTNSSKISN